MKVILYACLAFGLVPLQTTFMQYISIAGVRPDLCLVAASLIGFWIGPFEGLLLGISLGYLEDLFSAGGLWMNMLIKGAAGFLSGLIARQLIRITPQSIFAPILFLSVLSGLVLLVSARGGGGLAAILQGLPFILLPRALLDATLALSVCWVLNKTVSRESVLSD